MLSIDKVVAVEMMMFFPCPKGKDGTGTFVISSLGEGRDATLVFSILTNASDWV